MLARDRRDPSLPCTVCLFDGAEDRRRVEVVVEGTEVRPRDDEARERYKQGFPCAFPARHAHAGQLERVRVCSGEDGGAKEALDGETDPGVVEIPVQRARQHLRAWVVRITLPTLRCPWSRLGCARCVHSLEGSRRFLWCGIRYVSSRIHLLLHEVNPIPMQKYPQGKNRRASSLCFYS